MSEILKSYQKIKDVLKTNFNKEFPKHTLSEEELDEEILRKISHWRVIDFLEVLKEIEKNDKSN